MRLAASLERLARRLLWPAGTSLGIALAAADTHRLPVKPFSWLAATLAGACLLCAIGAVVLTRGKGSGA